VKKTLIIIGSVLVIGYLIFAVTYFNSSSHHRVCRHFEVVIRDSLHTQFVQSQDIIDLVSKHELYPVGKTFSEINTLAIRDVILTNQLVESVDVFTTPRGAIVANIRQREPILRVISDTRGSFYIDRNREMMPVSPNFVVHVPLATGAIDEAFAKNYLYDFAVFLSRNPQWNAWFEQIVVRQNQDVELIPRMGDFRIIMGSLDNYAVKLDNFALFIDRVLNVVGWNRYSEINLRFENQIVGVRR
jgi:cell division protein FtsQ